MDINEEIFLALLESHPDDLKVIKQYVRWVKVRRVIHDIFYKSAHWVRSGRRVHWVGRRVGI